MSKEFYSCGKLLITGEYLILRGARGLALPTSRGQHLSVNPVEGDQLIWSALDADDELWFQGEFDMTSMTICRSTDPDLAERLKTILNLAKKWNPDFLKGEEGLEVETQLEFPNDWGLGSSSTLIHLIAQWAQVDADRLLAETFGGSGYDVCVAAHSSPIRFHRSAEKVIAEKIPYSPPFTDKLWFVHLGKKQDTASELVSFADIQVSDRDLDQVSRITDDLIEIERLEDFEQLIREHDLLLSRILSRPTAQEQFPGFHGTLKYLGAWGGDFMLATGSKSEMGYFEERGMKTVLSYEEMIAHEDL